MNGEQGNALPEGTFLGQQYQVTKVLGVGGFGITYLAHDTNIGYKIAIKEYLPGELAFRNGNNTVRPRPANEGDFKKNLHRFLKEARTLAQFKHANIVRVYNYFEANNTAYMVMEYEEGQDLSVCLRRNKALDEDKLRKILFPMLDGMEELHAKDIIHRDIKPSNIFIRENGNPMLLDLGVARNILRNDPMTQVGTPRYSAPEQLYRPGKLGAWTDIYAFACVLYEIISGKKPISTRDRVTAVQMNQPDPLAPTAEVGRMRFSPPLLRAVDRAIRLEERDRPQSIAEWRQQFAPLTTRENANATNPTGRSSRSGSAETLSGQQSETTKGEAPRDDSGKNFGPKSTDEKRSLASWLRRFFGIGPAIDPIVPSQTQIQPDLHAKAADTPESGATRSNQVSEAAVDGEGTGDTEAIVPDSADLQAPPNNPLKDTKPVSVAERLRSSVRAPNGPLSVRPPEPSTSARRREGRRESAATEIAEAESVRETPSAANAEAASQPATREPTEPTEPVEGETVPLQRATVAGHAAPGAPLGPGHEGESDKSGSRPPRQLDRPASRTAEIWNSPSSSRLTGSNGHQYPDVSDAYRSSGRHQDGGNVFKSAKPVRDSENVRNTDQAPTILSPAKSAEPWMGTGRPETQEQAENDEGEPTLDTPLAVAAEADLESETAESETEDFLDAVWRPRSVDQDVRAGLPEPWNEGEPGKPESRSQAQPEKQANRVAGIWGPASSPRLPDSSGRRAPDVFDAHRSRGRRRSGDDVFSGYTLPSVRENRRLRSTELLEPEVTVNVGQEKKPEATPPPAAQAEAAVHVVRGNTLHWQGQEKEALDQWEFAIALVPEDKDLREKIEEIKRRLAGTATKPDLEEGAPDNHRFG